MGELVWEARTGVWLLSSGQAWTALLNGYYSMHAIQNFVMHATHELCRSGSTDRLICTLLYAVQSCSRWYLCVAAAGVQVAV